MQETEGRLLCGLSRVHIQKLREKYTSQMKVGPEKLDRGRDGGN